MGSTKKQVSRNRTTVKLTEFPVRPKETSQKPPHAVSDLPKDRTSWPYIAAVLLLPVLVLWRQDNTLFTGAHYIDPWVYFGFFKNLRNFSHDIFPATYYGSRLSWLLPGYLIHSVLSPVPASAVLHLLVQSISTLSLFIVLRDLAGPRAAFLTTLLFSVNQWVWTATGWDYPDGAGIAYWLLTLALLTRAVASGGNWKILGAGATAAGAVYVNLSWILLTPFLPVYYVVLMWMRGHRLWRSAASFCVWAGSGVLLLTAGLVAVNYRLGGFYWFYAPSIQYSQFLTGSHRWLHSVFGPYGLEAWLWFPLIGLITAAASIVLSLQSASAKSNVPVLLFAGQLVYAIAVFGFFQFRQSVSLLGIYYYASFLLPAVFLLLGVVFWHPLEQLSAGAFLLLCVAAAAASAIMWADPSGRLLPAWPVHNMMKALLGSAVLVAAFVFRKHRIGTLLALVGLFTFTVASRLTLHPEPHLHRQEFERIAKLRDRVEAVRNNGSIHFWFNESDPDALDYIALNSTYVGERSWLHGFPKGGCQQQVYPHDLIVVESTLENSTAIAVGGLATCWERFGLAPSVTSTFAAIRSNQPYTVTLVKAEEQSALIHPLIAAVSADGTFSLVPSADNTSKPLPPSRWKLIGDKTADLQYYSDGTLRVTTRPARYAAALLYPSLVATADGRYRFTLKYSPRSGYFSLSLIAKGRGVAAKVTSNEGIYLKGLDRELGLWVELKKGEVFDLSVSNNNNFEDRPASVVIDELTTAFIPLSLP